MEDIIAKYGENTATRYLLPIITNPCSDERTQYRNAICRINVALKEVASLAGLNIPLTMHVARHCWASVAKSKNIPLSTECVRSLSVLPSIHGLSFILFLLSLLYVFYCRNCGLSADRLRNNTDNSSFPFRNTLNCSLFSREIRNRSPPLCPLHCMHACTALC